MTARGVVREWLAGEGWGVVGSPETPGGCWTHFSSVRMPDDYRELQPGAEVELEWEAASQDGPDDYRAVRTWPVGAEPVDDAVRVDGGSGGWTSAVLNAPGR